MQIDAPRHMQKQIHAKMHSHIETPNKREDKNMKTYTMLHTQKNTNKIL